MARRTCVLAHPESALPGRRRFLYPLIKAISTAGAALVVIALLPAASQAATPKTVAEAQAQLDQLDDQAEVASEQVNDAQARLTKAQAAATAAISAAGRAHDLVLTEQMKISAFAAQAYESGGLSQGIAVVLDTTDPAQTMARIATLQQLSTQQSTALAAVKSADLRYQESLASAAQANVTATNSATELRKRQAAIKAAVAKTQQLLAQLTTAQRAQLLAAQKAKAAADQARATIALASYQRAQAAKVASRSLVRPAAPARVVQAAIAVPQSAGGSSVAQRAVAAAMSKLGARYVFGAAGPRTFDCSGLVQWAYGQAGVGTAHYTGTLWNSYRHISSSQLEPGDLVFFHSDHHHVGIYIGGGMMINAPQTGDVVKIASVSGHGAYSGAVRVVG